VVQRIDFRELEERLRQHVAELAQTPRVPGSAEHRRAAEYIRAHLGEAGFPVRDMQFNEAGFTGVNLLADPTPHAPNLPLLIVGAHYDSIPSSPGADDNASAVAALLEGARLLQPLLASGERSAVALQLVAYDLEEWGLIGSFLHSRDLHRSGTPVRGMISLEMLGYTDHEPGSQRLPPHLARFYPDVGNFIGVVGNQASQQLLQAVAGAMKTIDGLPVEHLAVPGDGRMLAETRLSDHSSFWDRGYKALMITDTSFFRNPHYHQASDRPETLDYPFLARVTAGVARAVAAILTPPRAPEH
jgi:Zn-dependent M28 family amino/carboxypeptidase